MSFFVQIKTFDSYIEANMVMGMLQEQGINCHLKDENTLTIDPLLNPALGGIKLMVFHTQKERAINIMEEAIIHYISDYPCPNCKSKSLEYLSYPETSQQRSGNWIKNLMKTFEKEKPKFHCAHCNSNFNVLPPLDD